MKKLLVLSLLLSAFTIKAEVQCITNITITCLNGANVLIAGSSNYNSLETYTSASAMDLMGQNCDSGTALTFTVVGCPSSSTDVATVSWACNSAVYCGVGEGGNSSCGTGGSFTITMPPHCGYLSVRVYSLYGCCTLTKCDLFSNHCDGGNEQ